MQAGEFQVRVGDEQHPISLFKKIREAKELVDSCKDLLVVPIGDVSDELLRGAADDILALQKLAMRLSEPIHYGLIDVEIQNKTLAENDVQQGSEPARGPSPANEGDDVCTEESKGQGPTAKEIVAFLRQHRERVVVVMLSRGGGFTHSQIAKNFGVSRSRCYRYEKWFEGLGHAYRQGIIAVGFAARAKHHGGIQAFDATNRLIASPQALEIIAAAQQQARDAERGNGRPPAALSCAVESVETQGPLAAHADARKGPLHGILANFRATLKKWSG